MKNRRLAELAGLVHRSTVEESKPLNESSRLLLEEEEEEKKDDDGGGLDLFGDDEGEDSGGDKDEEKPEDDDEDKGDEKEEEEEGDEEKVKDEVGYGEADDLRQALENEPAGDNRYEEDGESEANENSEEDATALRALRDLGYGDDLDERRHQEIVESVIKVEGSTPGGEPSALDQTDSIVDVHALKGIDEEIDLKEKTQPGPSAETVDADGGEEGQGNKDEEVNPKENGHAGLPDGEEGLTAAASTTSTSRNPSTAQKKKRKKKKKNKPNSN